MSTDWDLFCTDCNEALGLYDANHRDAECEKLRLLLPRFKNFPVELLKEAGFDTELNSDELFQKRVDLEWIVKHADHNVVTKSEYGDILNRCNKTVTCCDCNTRHTCHLDKDHEPPCVKSYRIWD